MGTMTAVARRSAWTLGRQAIVATALPLVAGIAALVGVLLSMQQEAAFERVKDDKTVVVQLLAAQMLGGVKWSKADVIERIYSAIAQHEASDLSDLVVVELGGGELARYRSPSFAAADLQSDIAAYGESAETRVRWTADHLVVVAPIGTAKDGTIGVLATAWSLAEVRASTEEAMLAGAAVGASTLLVLIGWLVVFIRRVVTQPIREMTGVMSELAAGNRSVAVTGAGRGDEIGAMAAAVIYFKDQLIAAERLQAAKQAADRAAYEAELRQRSAEEIADAANAANRAKSEFLATMSHEIRTPMNGVMGMLHLLLETGLDGKQREFAHIAKESADGLLAVINDILDYSKLEAGRIELEATSFSPSRIVGHVVSLLAARADGKDVALTSDLAPDVPEWLVGDPTRLRQVLLNLVGNAIKFTEAGEVAVSAARSGFENGRVEVRFAVRDTGIGVAPEARAKLFTRFSQADSSMTRKFGGAGLGLAISKQLVELMGGRIGVDSEPGRGSTFWFTIRCPIGAAPAEAEPIRAPETAAAAPARKLRVLVVEDNQVNQMLAANMLGRDGHAVDVVGDGLAAVAALRSRPYDVVLMDVQMPGMDGVTATKAIRRLAGPAGRVPIIALTANAMAGDRDAYLAAGMDDYVSKPIDARVLAAAIARSCAAQPGAAAEAPGSATGRRNYKTARELAALVESAGGLTDTDPADRRGATPGAGRPDRSAG
jgi:signal transduction histidine kinase/CheY-like chemotaxis protein